MECWVRCLDQAVAAALTFSLDASAAAAAEQLCLGLYWMVVEAQFDCFTADSAPGPWALLERSTEHRQPLCV